MNESTHLHVCDQIVNLVAINDPLGQELLLNRFSHGMRYLAAKLCPAHTNDCVSDTITIVVTYLREKRLEDPSALPAYIRTVMHTVAIGKRQVSDRSDASEIVLRQDQKTRQELRAVQDRHYAVRRALEEMSGRQRELLAKLYLNGEPEDQICQEMGLTEAEYGRLKSRGKMRLLAALRVKAKKRRS